MGFSKVLKIQADRIISGASGSIDHFARESWRNAGGGKRAAVDLVTFIERKIEADRQELLTFLGVYGLDDRDHLHRVIRRARVFLRTFEDQVLIFTGGIYTIGGDWKLIEQSRLKDLRRAKNALERSLVKTRMLIRCTRGGSTTSLYEQKQMLEHGIVQYQVQIDRIVGRLEAATESEAA